MGKGLTLDSGALIAAEKGSREFWRSWSVARADGVRVTVPATVLAQVWRGNSPVIARILAGCVVDNLTEDSAKNVGQALGRARRSDIVDASVVTGAIVRGDAIVTSDPDDIGRLVEAAGVRLKVLTV